MTISNTQGLSSRYYRQNAHDYSSLVKSAAIVGLGVFALRGGRGSRILTSLTRDLVPKLSSIGDGSIARATREWAEKTPTSIEKLYRDATQTASQLHDVAAYSHRMSMLTRSIHKEYYDQRPEIYRQVMSKVARTGHRGLEGNLHWKRVRDMIAPEEIGITGAEGDRLAQTVHGYISNTMRTRLAPDAEQFVNEAVEYNTELIEKALVRKGQETPFLSRMLDNTLGRVGLKPATVGDLMDSGYMAGRTVTNVTDQGARTIDVAQAFAARIQEGKVTRELRADPLIFIDDGGQVMDLRYLSSGLHRLLKGIDENVQTPIINLNPLRLLQYRTIRDVQQSPQFGFLNVGNVQAHVDGSDVSMPVAHLFAAGDIANILGRNADGFVGADFVPLSGTHGAFSHLSPKMVGLHNVDKTPPKNFFSRIRQTLDVGDQNFPSYPQQMASIVTKFKDPHWTRNIVRSLSENRLDVPARESSSILRTLLARNLPGMTQKDLDLIGADRISQALGGINVDFSTSEGILKAFEDLALSRHIATADKTTLHSKQLQKLWDKYKLSPTTFLNERHTVSNKMPWIFNHIEVFSREDELRQVVSREIIDRIQATEGASLRGLNETIDNLETFTSLDRISQQITRLPRDPSSLGAIAQLDAVKAQEDFLAYFKADTDTGKNIDALVSKLSPKGQQFSEYDEYLRAIGEALPQDQTHIYVKKYKGFLGSLHEINENIKTQGANIQALAPLQRYFGQFTAGRHNLKDTTVGTFFPFFYMERLSTTLGALGAGLSPNVMGSTQQIFGNLISKRWFAALGIAATWQYGNYEMNRATGTDLTEIGADTLAGTQMLATHTRDALGLTDRAKRSRQLYAGIEHLTEDSPIGMPLRMLGLTGDKSAEELDLHLREGYEPVKSGRWWRLGSKTPWYGDGTSYYQQSWYRRAHGENPRIAQLYGSEDEYWRNHWLPTPRFPLAPVRHFLTDPYFLERKQYWDRPYPETGPISILSEMPIIGPLLDATVGEILKPPIKMHQGELFDINRDIIRAGNETERPVAHEAGYAYVTPSGMTTSVQLAGPQARAVEESMSRRERRASSRSRREIRTINEETIHTDAIPHTQLPPGPAGMRIMPARRRDNQMPRDTTDVMSMTDPRFHMGQTFYSVTEIAGIYGFATGELLLGGAGSFGQGNEMLYRGPVIERANMTSPSRQLWDANLGGFGADISEIYRRFFPRERRIDYINPIRNTMPDWMPGEDYFINFQQGDPFIQPYPQLMRGEARLPGRGYESINQLHPDQFGRYGAFDRFKILADVAPHSDQYRYWKSVASETVTDPKLRERMAEIRRQVTERKQKHQFYNYRFKYADIERQTVTVQRVIDQNTFVTKEHPDNPIRFAGMRVNKEHADAVARYIRPGMRLQIGYTADELNMFSKDQLETIRATVWKGRTNINRALIEAGIATEDEDDFSPAGVHARFTRGEIFQARLWERFAHLDTPLHTRFLKVRSPLEVYKRQEVYGQSFQQWTPSDQLMPTLDSFFSKGAVTSMILTSLLGAAFGGNPRARVIGAGIGALIGLAGGAYVDGYQATQNERWLPDRRKREREVSEYFDMLEYVKHRRLFSLYNEKAIQHEDTDMAAFLRVQEIKGRTQKEMKDQLAQMTKDGIVKETATEEELATINYATELLRTTRNVYRLGPYAMKALEHRNAYKSTLYGLDPTGPWKNIYQALPSKDRPFFSEFVNASPAEREEILELVPKNQRRIYQALWRMERDTQVSLDSYFEDYYLPSVDWAGWREDVLLDDIKYKVIKNEALNITEFGMWEDDQRRAEMLQVDAPKFRNARTNIDDVRAELNKIIRGANVQNPIIEIARNINASFSIDVEIEENLQERFKNQLYKEPEILLR